MEVLLLSDIPGIGRRNDLMVVGNGYALNYLLPHRKAIVATPSVRKTYAEQIRLRALEREQEVAAKRSAMGALDGKTIVIVKKATKTGKLYAALSAALIKNAIHEQLHVAVNENDIVMDDHIKTAGEHSVQIKAGDKSATLTVSVKAE
jgi:large subunit ribosomal protein L9